MPTIGVGVADQHVTVAGPSPAVLAWVSRYFSPWWTVDGAVDGETAGVCAAVDEPRYMVLHDQVLGADHAETVYAKARTFTARSSDGATLAVAPGEALAYRLDPTTGALLVVGQAAQPVSLAACRLVREVARARLDAAGWTLMHASAAVRRVRPWPAAAALGLGLLAALGLYDGVRKRLLGSSRP